MSQRDADHERMIAAVTDLMEHFETVQIFVTRVTERDEGGGTMNANYGGGNWFARFGQVDAWLIKEKETLRESVRPDRDQDQG